MKFLSILLALASFAHAQPITIGDPAVEVYSGKITPNYLYTQLEYLPTAGVLSTLSFYEPTAAGNLILGIYSVNAGYQPATLLAQTAPFPAVAGWNTGIPIFAPILPAGWYYLAFISDTAGATYAFSLTEYAFWYASATMPATFSLTGTTLGWYPMSWSFYATVDPTTPGQVTVTWSPTLYSTFVGYNVYYTTNPAAMTTNMKPPIAANQYKTMSTLARFTGLSSGIRFYFGVTSYDNVMGESLLSNVVGTPAP